MKKIPIVLSAFVMLFAFSNCGSRDTKEATAAAESFLSALKSADTKGLTNIAPWFDTIDETRASGLFNLMKNVSSWKIGTVRYGGGTYYVDATLVGDDRNTTLVIPVKIGTGKPIVLERIETSVHIDIIPLSGTGGKL